MNTEFPGYLQSLSEFQRAFLDSYPPTFVFAVISWGCAGTAWIARTLNSHPDIYCVHAANAFWQVLGGCERLDGLSYLRVIASQGHAHAAAGDVHGVGRHHIPALRLAFDQLFNAAVVVREPIPRLRSQLALFERYKDVEGSTTAWDLGYIDSLIEHCKIALPRDDFRFRFFVHAANMLNAILEEREVGKIYRSEDLTSDTSVLGDFVDEITRARVRPSSEWLDAAIQIHPVNPHAESSGQRQFEAWEIDVIRKVVDPRAWEMYERLGYTRPVFVRGGS
jgi:hypothetical protein